MVSSTAVEQTSEPLDIRSIRRIFRHWPFPRGRGLLLKAFSPLLRSREFVFDIADGVLVPSDMDDWISINGFSPAGCCLLLEGSPTAVPRLVPGISIDSIKSLSFRPWPHILREAQETPAPSLANLNSPAAVVVVFVMILVRASLNHLSPTCIRPFQTLTACGPRSELLGRRLKATPTTYFANDDP